MQPYMLDGVIYVPMTALEDDGLIGDGYVRLDALPKDKQQEWEFWLSEHLITELFSADVVEDM